ncbi:hypothetical protein EJ04DRAFT_514648 [Polyplosphaeria fusca]|uniref:Uncharacterized protein n=1 Tax=Polyplosphaeria fusca TaxID=682080 RepID=A0A9P4QU57_9PLEO|nr:hypothetical protein EJ04DRAFT_514648 [Polyplosphaeria fusca]
MSANVHSLHQITPGELDRLPFSARDFSLFQLGDTRLARGFGMQLAKHFTQRILAQEQGSAPGVVVLFAGPHIPTASNQLRHQFTYYLNRFLISQDRAIARNVDICASTDEPCRCEETGKVVMSTGDTQLEGKRCIFVDKIRRSAEYEESIRCTLEEKHAKFVHFLYVAALPDAAPNPALEENLRRAAIKSFKDLDMLVQKSWFAMTTEFARFMFRSSNAEFCQFLRRQEDDFAHHLLNVGMIGECFASEDCKENFGFLLWDVEARESLHLEHDL